MVVSMTNQTQAASVNISLQHIGAEMVALREQLSVQKPERIKRRKVHVHVYIGMCPYTCSSSNVPCSTV